ncbi:MAG: hypothetical protein JST55_14610 [Bacteroidetes bacterium]|nr:hypothetical protein [Bacteroidota bacterium]
MAFKFNLQDRFYKDFIAKSKDIQAEALKHGIQISKNPTTYGTKYTSKLNDFWKFDFTFKSISYRVVYTVSYCRQTTQKGQIYCLHSIPHQNKQLQNCNGLVDYVMFKTRQAMDNIYKLKKNNLNSYKRYI